jgi:DNA-directed RNA polymerase sigma subunit (sigma70/sigma32)
LAAALVLQLLYSTPKPPEKPLSNKERNNLIRVRYSAGETLEALAHEFKITVQRVHQIVHHRHH